MTITSTPSMSRSRRVASRPSIRGIRMSISTTSRARRSTWPIASRPSTASPTTSMSGRALQDHPHALAGDRLVVGDDRRGCSSTGAPAAALARTDQPPPSCRPGRERAADERDPLAHPLDPAAGRADAGAAGAVVLDGDRQRVVAVADERSAPSSRRRGGRRSSATPGSTRYAHISTVSDSSRAAAVDAQVDVDAGGARGLEQLLDVREPRRRRRAPRARTRRAARRARVVSGRAPRSSGRGCARSAARATGSCVVRPAPADCSAIALRWWPAMSCTSRAIRSRSSATARWTSRSRSSSTRRASSRASRERTRSRAQPLADQRRQHPDRDAADHGDHQH